MMAGEDGDNGGTGAAGAAGLGANTTALSNSAANPTNAQNGANTGNVPATDGNDAEADDEDGREEYDDFDDLELLEWPHHEFANCVCCEDEIVDMDFDEFFEFFKDRTEMDEEAMRDFHSSLWMHRHTTLGSRAPLLSEHSHRGGRAGITYEWCKPHELKRFVVDRGLPDSYREGVTLNFFYVRLLRRDDRSTTFRFMDLPPELRINVCRLLFSTGYNKPKDVAILRTCRQVYEEVKELPYSEPDALVSFYVWNHGTPNTEKFICVNGIQQDIFDGHGRFYCLPRAIDDFPEYMRRLQRLEVRMVYQLSPSSAGTVPATKEWLPINQMLFALSSFLMEGHQLKDLTIRVQLPSQIELRDLEQCLYPIRRIRNVPKVHVEGAVPDYVARKIKHEISSSRPVINTLRQWKLLQSEATAQMELFEVVEGDGCDCGECSFSPHAQTILLFLKRLSEAKQECCLSGAHEDNFLARLRNLQVLLQALDVETVMIKLQAVEAKQEAAGKGTTAMIDKRLLEAAERWTGGKLYSKNADSTNPSHDWSDDEDEGEDSESWEANVAKRKSQRPSSAASSHFTIPDEDFGNA